MEDPLPADNSTVRLCGCVCRIFDKAGERI